MSSTITIPTPILGHLRRGLLSKLGGTAALIDNASMQPHGERHPQRFTRPLAALDAYRALLDEIGWSETPKQHHTTIDMHPHLWALTTALQAHLTAERDFLTSNPTLRAQRQAKRTIRQITRFLTANRPAPKTPPSLTAKQWMSHTIQTLAACIIPTHSTRHNRREIPIDIDALQRTVLRLLLQDQDGAMCSVRQLAPHLGGRAQAYEAITALREVGLVHTIGDHTSPTLAARTYHQLHA